MNPPTQPSATPAKSTIDDATHAEWTEAQRREWYAKSAKIEGDSPVSAGKPSATHGVTPRTQALWMKHHAFCNEDEATEALCDFRDLGNTLETELAAANDKAERYRLCTLKQDAELADLRAENERLNGWVCELQTLIDNCGYPSGTDYAAMTARAERAELALANARCPHIVSTNEGTQYCALAESSVAKLEAQLAAARKDSERFNLLATLLEDVNMGDIDPTKHRTEDNEWPDAWRAAIDAAMTSWP